MKTTDVTLANGDTNVVEINVTTANLANDILQAHKNVLIPKNCFIAVSVRATFFHDHDRDNHKTSP